METNTSLNLHRSVVDNANVDLIREDIFWHGHQKHSFVSVPEVRHLLSVLKHSVGSRCKSIDGNLIDCLGAWEGVLVLIIGASRVQACAVPRESGESIEKIKFGQ